MVPSIGILQFLLLLLADSLQFLLKNFSLFQHQPDLTSQQIPLFLIIRPDHVIYIDLFRLILVVIETGGPLIIFVIIALHLVQRISIAVRASKAFSLRLFIEFRLDNFLLGHLAIGWNLGLLHHPPQRLVLIPKLVNLQTHLISYRLDKCLGIGLDPLHLHPYHLVLPLQLLEVPQCSVHMVFVLVLLSDKSNVRMLFSQIRFHNGYELYDFKDHFLRRMYISVAKFTPCFAAKNVASFF